MATEGCTPLQNLFNYGIDQHEISQYINNRNHAVCS